MPPTSVGENRGSGFSGGGETKRPRRSVENVESIEDGPIATSIPNVPGAVSVSVPGDLPAISQSQLPLSDCPEVALPEGSPISAEGEARVGEGEDALSSLRCRIRAELEEEFRARLHQKLREAAAVVKACADREIAELTSQLAKRQGELEAMRCQLEEAEAGQQRAEGQDREYWTGMVKKVGISMRQGVSPYSDGSASRLDLNNVLCPSC